MIFLLAAIDWLKANWVYPVIGVGVIVIVFFLWSWKNAVADAATAKDSETLAWATVAKDQAAITQMEAQQKAALAAVSRESAARLADKAKSDALLNALQNRISSHALKDAPLDPLMSAYLSGLLHPDGSTRTGAVPPVTDPDQSPYLRQ